MNWLKNNHPAVITTAIFALGFAIFLYASFTEYVSYDAYWHLKMGQDLLGSGLSPRVDHYSYTHAGQAIASLPYLFQILLATFVSAFGTPEGFQLIKFFSFILLMAAVYGFYREVKTPWYIIAVTLPYLFLFVMYRYSHSRPEIFDNALVVLALVFYLKASASFSHRNLVAIAVLQLFWVNYHAPIIGYVIFFGLFLDKAIDILRQSPQAVTWQRWAGWGAVLFLIGFINPEFQHPLFSMLNVSGGWGQIVNELQNTAESVPNSSLFTLFFVVAAYLVIALAIQRQYGLALLSGIFAFQFWSAFSLVSMAGLVIFLLLAFSLSKVDFARVFKQISPAFANLLRFLTLVLAISGVFLSASKAKEFHENSNADDFPVDIVSYLKETYPQGGRIFNRLRDGGYLLYQLSPEFKIYIDGRTNVLYPIDFTRRYVSLYSAESGQSMTPEVNRYGIDFAIFPLNLALPAVGDNSNPLAVEYVSKHFVLMTSAHNYFPLASRIMYFPMCWRSGYQPGLADEYKKAQQILPPDSALTPILASLGKLNQSANAEAFFAAMDNAEIRSAYQQRLLGYIALETNLVKQALHYFGAIEELDSLDLLMMAYAALNDQNYDATENLLLTVLSESWVTLKKRELPDTELAIAVSLLEKLKQRRALSAESENYRLSITKSLLEKRPELKLPLDSIIPQGNCGRLFSAANSANN